MKILNTFSKTIVSEREVTANTVTFKLKLGTKNFMTISMETRKFMAFAEVIMSMYDEAKASIKTQ